MEENTLSQKVAELQLFFLIFFLLSPKCAHCALSRVKDRTSSFIFAIKCLCVCLSAAFFILGGTAHAQTTCSNHTSSDPPTEEDLLIVLYCATDGENWRDKNNWLSSMELNQWSRVTTSNSKVTRLHLHENQLSGTIPSELGNLTNLERLVLYNNQLSGTIPSELGNLTNRKQLKRDYWETSTILDN